MYCLRKLSNHHVVRRRECCKGIKYLLVQIDLYLVSLVGKSDRAHSEKILCCEHRLGLEELV